MPLYSVGIPEEGKINEEN